MKKYDKKFIGEPIKKVNEFIENFFDENVIKKQKVIKQPQILIEYTKIKNDIISILDTCHHKNIIKKSSILNLIDEYKKILYYFKDPLNETIKNFFEMVETNEYYDDKIEKKEKIVNVFNKYSKELLDIFDFDIKDDIKDLDYFLLYNSILQNINYGINDSYPKDIFSNNIIDNKVFPIDVDKIKTLKTDLFKLSNYEYIEVNKVLIENIHFIRNDFESYSKEINIIFNKYTSLKSEKRKDLFDESINKIECSTFFNLFIKYVK
jgi:hypothetical protein